MIEMIEIAQYLQKHYYAKYDGCPPHLIPDNATLIRSLDLHKDKIVMVTEGKEIKGIAIFLTLSDDSFAKLDTCNIGNIDVLYGLLQEKGSNLHFILLTADGLTTIMQGIRQAKKLNPKTVSWWNPDRTYLHRYNLN